MLQVGLGVHPWWVHRAAGGWPDRLAAALAAAPAALLGEIGLDLAARDMSAPGRPRLQVEPQMLAFELQLAVAADLGRPVSVHLVRGHGKALQLLQRAAKEGGLPPAIALHSYSGSAEMISLFLKVKYCICLVCFHSFVAETVSLAGEATHARVLRPVSAQLPRPTASRPRRRLHRPHSGGPVAARVGRGA